MYSILFTAQCIFNPTSLCVLILSQKRLFRFIHHIVRGKLKDYVMCNSRVEGEHGGIQSKPSMDGAGCA